MTACLYTAKYLVSGVASVVEGGALLVQSGRILATGTLAELRPLHPHCELIDFGDALIVPLLINAHTHLELSDFPQWAQKAGYEAEPTSFIDWILTLIKVKAKLDQKVYQCSLINGIEQSVAAGTGAVGDILAHHSARDAYVGKTLEGTLYLETLGQKPEIISRLKPGLFAALKEGYSGAVKLGISPHSPYTINAGYLRQIYRHCQCNRLYCSTHVAESVEEVEFLQKGRGDIASTFYPFVGWEQHIPRTSGLSPVDYLHKQGGLFPQNLLVHGVQLSADEISLLAEKNMTLALCPRSNARLKVGQAPAAELLRAGVSLCLGTDSLASCDSLSIWDEMAFAHSWFHGSLDAPTLFRMATAGGAEALGLRQSLGTLEKGKNGGFQVLQPKTGLACSEIFDYFISSNCAQDIVQVYHNGKAQLSGVR